MKMRGENPYYSTHGTRLPRSVLTPRIASVAFESCSSGFGGCHLWRRRRLQGEWSGFAWDFFLDHDEQCGNGHRRRGVGVSARH